MHAFVFCNPGDQNLDEFVRQYQTVTVVPNVVSTTPKSLTAEINFKAFERFELTPSEIK